MLSLPLLSGCFHPVAVPVQPIPPAPAAHDPPEKGLVNGLKPLSPAKTNTAPVDDAEPASIRRLLLLGGWYRIPLTAEESAASEALVVPPLGGAKAADFRYRHAGLEQLMARPLSPSQRAELRELAADSDRNVAVTAAIGRARQGDTSVAGQLRDAIEEAKDNLPLPARCAAVEAFGQLPGESVKIALQTLVDRYGQFTPGASTGYQANLHAELLRALARHSDAGDDPRFIAAAQVPSALVRIEILRAWAAGTHGSMPAEIVDLRSDGEPRVRAAALTTLAARKHPAARDFLTSALHDVDLEVRLAAIRGLGQLDDPQARAILADLLKDRFELIRAEAVAAIAIRGSRAVVLGAAADTSWRVRLKVAAALAAYGDRDATAGHPVLRVAHRLLDDRSAEVERQVVRSLAGWPWEMAGPVLLDALSKDAVTVRKLAAEQLAARWPAGGQFPFEAPPARRAEALSDLHARYQREFPSTSETAEKVRANGTEHSELSTIGRDSTGLLQRSPSGSAPGGVSDEQIEKLLVAKDFRALGEIGPPVVEVLQRLAIDRKLTLPEPVYHDVLPRQSAVFAALDRMHGENADRRRRAVEELAALAVKQPLGRLAIARLCELATAETDAAVWLSALDALGDNGSEPAVRMVRLALGQSVGEVRRRACEYLAAHPDPAHEVFLVPLLGDSEQAVVVAAIRALAPPARSRISMC